MNLPCDQTAFSPLLVQGEGRGEVPRRKSSARSGIEPLPRSLRSALARPLLGQGEVRLDAALRMTQKSSGQLFGSRSLCHPERRRGIPDLSRRWADATPTAALTLYSAT